MNADTLADDLWNHLHWWLAEGPSGRRRWVMDIWWLNQCRQISLSRSGGYLLPFIFEPMATLTAIPETLFGVPVDVRDHDDRPGWQWRVPHLEAA